MEDFEKLGQFYLGKKYNLESKASEGELLLYDARDLVTHGVCVGMTGSGKTGLGVALLEEAAMDSIPSIVIDPKGDMANLLLTFPGLDAAEFLPWINPDEAARSGQTPEAYAESQAGLWKKGLAAWGQDGERMRKLRASAHFTIYTPGSSAGTPVALLAGFRRPGPEVLEDHEALADLMVSSATGLLGLVGVTGDPALSRENILVSNILGHHWSGGRDVSIETLLRSIQTPPFERLGAFDIESFFPSRDRFELALRLNSLLASPGFGVWLEGEPMDVGRFLHTPEGKPKISIFSIAHLGENERMFFVTLLLNQVVAWMRSQPGTTSLRALVYMDEVAGYLPPVANPPSKKPLMILFKQARAFGVGVLLATQNPVDLDYKALSNAGTWFVGRLQTPQDIDRLVEGLGSASPAEESELRRAIAALGKRVFLMKNIHEEAPAVFETRWCLSYLRGPLTLGQIKLLAATAAPQPSAPAPASAAQTSAPSAEEPSAARPVVPPEIPEFFIPLQGEGPEGGEAYYVPNVCAFGEVHYSAGPSVQAARAAAATGDLITVDWAGAEPVTLLESDLHKEPSKGAGFGSPSPEALKAANYKAWARDYADYVYRTSSLELYRSAEFKLTSDPGESEGDFRIRLGQLARERRDEKADALRGRYGPKIAALEERMRKAEQKVEKEKGDVRQAGVQTALNLGATLLGAFMGRKKLSTGTIGRASTTMRSGMRTAKEKADIAAAEENLEALRLQKESLEAEFAAELEALEGSADPMRQEVQSAPLRPRKADIRVRLVALVWFPGWKGRDGRLVPAGGLERP
ncbi:MAG: ATP-binding protein [Acidobacteria bacterium]|nr:ATP-binding protein [Acidobacteriota bacterium]